MAKKKVLFTLFNFSFGFLKQLADALLSNTARDLIEFTDRGFSISKKTEFELAIQQFDDFPSDEQLEGIQMDTTKSKNEYRANLEKQLRTFFLSAKNVFGDATGKYREFGNPDLTRQTDDVLVRSGKTMVKTATKYITDLATEGITADKISKLNDTVAGFDTSIDKQREAIKSRDTSTEDRAVLANAVYNLIVKYADVGKDIWRETSEAKYNDYVIYNTKSGGPEAVTPPTP